MLRHIVKDYQPIDPVNTQLLPGGESAAPKELIFHIMQDNAATSKCWTSASARAAWAN